MKMPVREHKKARIEIIPLIDVIFFCLATFVLVTLSLNRNKTVQVDLPNADTGYRANQIDEFVNVTIDDAGSIFWDKDALTYDQFLIRLTEYRDKLQTTNQPPKMMLNFADQSMFGQAILLLDEIRKAQIFKVQVVVKPSPGKG